MNQKLKFYLVIIVQIVFILGMIIVQRLALVSGDKILLKITPIDPIDLFRGYYAHLNYEISQVFTSQIELDKKEFKRGEYIYATLAKEPNEKFYKVVAIHLKKPLPKPKGFIIKGRIGYFYDRFESKIIIQTEDGKIKEYTQSWRTSLKPNNKVVLYLDDKGQIKSLYAKKADFKPPKDEKVEFGTVSKVETKKDTDLNIKYGIESYFVEETKAPLIEKELRGRQANLYAEISLGKDGRALISRIFLNDKPLEY